jgi:putative ABC transport system substrate-binding protein
MRRREFLRLLGGAAALPHAGLYPAQAQQAPGLRRIGFLGNSTAKLEANLIGPFREGLRAHGYQEGRNIHIESRWAEGNYQRFPALIAELLAAKVEVIVTAGTPATKAVKSATSSMPLVMIAVGDPVGTGIVASLARPGGNITGLASISPDLEGKRLQLLREINPALAHVAFLFNPSNPFYVTSMKQIEAAVRALRVKLLSLPVSKTEDLDGAFDKVLKERPEALLVLADRVFLHNRNRIAEFAVKHRLPTMMPYKELVEAGGLIAYGPSYEGMHRRAADYVDKILKGAKPSDLPVEQPTQFDLRVNLKAAKAIGVKIPEAFLLRADQVIE